MAQADGNNRTNPQWLQELIDGIRSGIAPSAENRREALSVIRDVEAKDEPPRAIYTLMQNPLIDSIRQRNTFGNKTGIETLGLPQLTDDGILYRANAGLIAGPRPEDVVPKELWVANQALPADPIMAPDESEAAYKKRALPYRQAREQNLEIYKEALKGLPRLTKAGQLLGSLAADVSSDTSRSLWWLINAVQATENLISESVASTVAPDLFGAAPLNDLPLAERQGKVRYVQPPKSQIEEMMDEPLPSTSVSEAFQKGMLTAAEEEIEREKIRRNDPNNYVATDAGVKKIRGGFRQRRFNPNLVNVAAMLPGAIGINAGIGLLGGEDSGTILPGTGRKLGYEAAVPSEFDPTKTDNVLLEGLTKYFLGREGQQLGWHEGFQAERPDVSKEEYSKYKGYERSKDIDLNLLDGDFNLGGILKGTTDGIHGAELQFLGKNVPLNEAIIPTVGALIGTAAGGLLPNVRRIRKRSSNPDLRKYIPKKYYETDEKGQVIKDKYGRSKLKPEHEWESDELRVDKYSDPEASRLTRLLGNVPEVISRDKGTGGIVRNPNLENNKTLKKIEDFFIKPQQRDASGNQLVGADELRRDRVLGTVFGGGMAGLAAGSMLGASLEEDRRRRNFEENYPGRDYEIAKETFRRMGDRVRETTVANKKKTAEDRERFGKTGQSNRSRQADLYTEATLKQAAIDQVADAYLKSKVQTLNDESLQAILEAQEIERQIEEDKRGSNGAIYV